MGGLQELVQGSRLERYFAWSSTEAMGKCVIRPATEDTMKSRLLLWHSHLVESSIVSEIPLWLLLSQFFYYRWPVATHFTVK